MREKNDEREREKKKIFLWALFFSYCLYKKLFVIPNKYYYVYMSRTERTIVEKERKQVNSNTKYKQAK